ncbi:PAS domain-containing protein [Agrobacterium vitis]|uniref:sensor histidine kinase n=1 Tax=Agrobacterium vitis TaxID=373 RepID=UPI000872E750|nr:PAS domain-containing protein [Agrobacterium vitis]MCE6074391.1 PAS domain-containing protein [Agrobacterium vitis]MCF1451054.1 PAS domain-containing protein [Agrobacterium vitis]MCF1466960.1 PAS domain-containing protein [Agrobacterium vitis]MCM2470340.1 PAS domain-containing protein [Agrobacterium vitis]MUO70715.1 PAS domain-containing protein [Agrobacterium vitis]
MTNLPLNEILPQDIIDTSRDAVLILSQDLTVLAANQAFYANFQIASEETLGRQLYDLKGGHWNIPGLRLLLEQIVPLDTVVNAHEVDVVFPDLGHRIMLVNVRRVQRTTDAESLFLMSIDDVTEARLASAEAERSWILAQNIVDTVRDPLLVLEHDMSVVFASRSFLKLFGVQSTEVVGQQLKTLGDGQWNVAALNDLLERVLPRDEHVDGLLLEDDFPGLGRRVFKINARKIFRPGNHVTRMLVVFEDATEAVMLDRHRDILAAELAHRIKNSLQIISSFVSHEIRRAAEPCAEGYKAMQARIRAVAELYDVIAQSSAFGPVNMETYLKGITTTIRKSLLSPNSNITISTKTEPLSIQPDYAVSIGLIVNELATNAVKYAFPSGQGEVVLGFQRREGEVALTVSDNGIGLSGKSEGSGLGTQFVKAFVKQLGGSLASATSSNGTTYTVRLPPSILAE